jgi:hypothetical protein
MLHTFRFLRHFERAAQSIFHSMGRQSIAAIIFCSLGASLAQAGKLIEIKVPDALSTQPRGINNRGEVVGTYWDSNFHAHGFIRSPSGEYTTIDSPLPYTYGLRATGINNAGTITGFFEGPNGRHGFVRSSDGIFDYFDNPDAPGYDQPLKINDAGTVFTFVYVEDGSALSFTRDANGTFTNFEYKGLQIFALGMNDDATTVGNIYSAKKNISFSFIRSADGHYTQLKSRSGQYNAWDINNSGTVVGSYSEGQTIHGLIRSASGKETYFDAPGANDTEAVAINSKGVIAGYFTSPKMVRGVFVRSAEGKFKVFPCYSSWSTIAMNDHGVVTGSCNDQSGYLFTP